MSPSVHYVTRTTGAGKRFYVRFRVGGRETKLKHAGTAYTVKERDALIARVRLELAETGNFDPRPQQPVSQSLRSACDGYLATRVDLSDATRRAYLSAAGSLVAELAKHGVHTTEDVTPQRVRAWLAGLSAGGSKQRSLRLRLQVLRSVLEYADVEPNPARHRSIRLPREERVEVQPPTGRQFVAILNEVPDKYRLILKLLEATGMRVNELLSLRWGDVDVASSKWRVTGGKTAAARRWVEPPAHLFSAVLALCPHEDRVAKRVVFQGVRYPTVYRAMRTACKNAGVPDFTPHDLRHRYISRLVQAGVPITVVREKAGHSKASLTLDVYSHVILED